MRIYGYNPNKHFVILGIGRTGSTYLCAYLNNYSNIYCWSEIFGGNVLVYENVKESSRKFLTTSLRDASPQEWLRVVYEDHKDVAFGFKVLNHNTCNGKFANWQLTTKFANTNLTKILIYRKNLLARQISCKVAGSKNGHFGSTTKEGINKGIQVDIHINQLTYIKNYINKSNSEDYKNHSYIIRTNSNKLHIIEYSDLIKDTEKCIKPFLSDIGIDYDSSVVSSMKKVNSKNHMDHVKNKDFVVEWFKKELPNHLWMLENEL